MHAAPLDALYLDNFRSIKGAPNENHGRELLELHTVGRASGYTEAMVKDSAKILSGWTVGTTTDWAVFYDQAKHTTGPVTVLEFSDANAASDGRELAERYLRFLANHPATARTIARKLALRFVSDTPSDALVEVLAATYLSSGTDITAMLRQLVIHPEFVGSAGRKVRNTVDDLVATARVLQVEVHTPTRNESFARAIAYAHKGILLWQWPRPDGAPERNADWASASRMLGSFRMHWNMAGGYYPKVDATYKTARWWLPQRRLRLDEYVDHMCRMVLGRGSTSRDLKAVCQATGRAPGEIVTKDHPLVRYLFVRMVVCLLDSPSHMSR
ncbi:DUF1800 family protein [Nocardioides mesophilus]|uniref:DUF1800 family protein n=1 Tax=Nocardioides mesophilus TaxID=433659 RepID=A0A7G9REP2_9ACTN|nr:DUF1800 family protein [Nocardioides mesophilus]QNN54067.1 DUF1800 family protein [Nocardioides mesophilus]